MDARPTKRTREDDAFRDRTRQIDETLKRVEKDLGRLADLYEEQYRHTKKQDGPSVSMYRRMIQVINGTIRLLTDITRDNRKAFFSHEDFRTKVIDQEIEDEKSGVKRNPYERTNWKKLPVKRNDRHPSWVMREDDEQVVKRNQFSLDKNPDKNKDTDSNG